MSFSKCLSLSLTAKNAVENDEIERQKQLNKRIEKELNEDRKKELSCLKLLLLGTGESGKSTLIKQMRIIHIDGFSREEKVDYRSNICMNIRDSMVSILSAMEHLNIPFQKPEKREIQLHYLLNEAMAPKFDYPPIFFEYVQDLWADEGVKICFQRCNAYQLMDSAKYSFLDRVRELQDPQFIPTNQDILRCRKLTDAVSEIKFTVKERNGTSIAFKVFDVGGQKGERKKWFQLFDSVTAILFLIDSSSYDLKMREDRTKNRLVDAMEVFQQAWSNKYLQSVPMLIFINKIDILDEKIHAGRHISPYLREIEENASQEESALEKTLELKRASVTTAFGLDTIAAPPNLSKFNGRRRLTTAGFENVSQRFSSSWSDSLANVAMINLLSSRKKSVNTSLSTTNCKVISCKHSARTSQCGSTASTVQLTCRPLDLLRRIPFDTFQPTNEEQREFLLSFPVDESLYKKTKGKTTRSPIPITHPETVRTACYIKRLFAEITKQRIFTSPNGRERRCLFYYTCAVDTNSIQKVLDGCRAFLMEEHMEKFCIT